MDERVSLDAAFREGETRHAFLLDLDDALRPLASPTDIQGIAARRLGEHLRVNRVAYFDIRGTDYVVERDYANGAMPLSGRYPLANFGQRIIDTYRRGEVLVVDDVAIEAGLSADDRSAHAAIQIGAFIGVPLIKNGEFVFGLTVHSRRARRWSAQEVALVKETAERTWTAVVQARAEAALARSEEKYRTLFANIDEAFCVGELLYDAEGRPFDRRLIETNPRYHQLVGNRFAIGTTAREVSPRIDNFWFERYHEVISTGQALRFEHYLPEAQCWLDIYLSRVGGVGSHTYAAVFHDITERRRRETHLAFLAEVSRDLVDLSDSRETMQVVGTKVCVHLDVASCAFVEVDDAADQARVTIESRRDGAPGVGGAHRIGDFFSGELRTLLRAGTEVVSHDVIADTRLHGERFLALGIGAMIGAPVLTAGQWRFVFCIHHATAREWRPDEVQLVRELTARIASRLEQVNTEQALREADRRKDQFLATLAHELRNPLAPLRNGLHLLRKLDTGGARTQEVHQMMERQLTHMVRLVDDLMEVSRISRGMVELRRERIDLAGVVHAAIETSRPLMEAGRHTLSLALSPEPLWLDADPVRLTQVFTNLLNNAARYTDAGGYITVGTRREGQGVRISVQDNGLGIATDMLGRVFDLFMQADPAHGRTQGGLGIGLTLVRAMVQLHQGTVEARSDGAGKGSEFVVWLPLPSG